MKNALIICLFFAVHIQAQTVDGITESLTKGVVKDSEKVVRIYEWITRNVNYEPRYLQNRAADDTTLLQEPYTVVVRKKAVCIGYAKLFQAMCQSAKIEAEIIAGISKNINGILEREEHAWNTVKINGNWYLVDATWGAGYLTTAKQYFLTDPSVFAETHFPNDPMWQLLKNPKTYACFLKRTNCFSDEKNRFSFRDTIAAWQKLDSFNQIKNSAERSLAYNPNCLEALRNLANAYSSEAFRIFQNFAAWRNRAIGRQNVTEKEEEILNLLETIENNLQQARFIYDRIITTFVRKGEYTDAQFNRDLMQENLLKLENERQFVAKFFKKK